MEVRVVKELGIYHVGRKGTEVKKILVKDIAGDTIGVSVWKEFIDEVKVGQIYKFFNLRVTDYPKEKPHNLTTTPASRILDITEEYKEEFKHISLADGVYNGTVQVIHDVYMYDACPSCKCSVDKTASICSKCKKILHERCPTFKYEVCIELEDLEVIDITGFESSVKQLNLNVKNFGGNEELTEKLNDIFESKKVVLLYNVNSKNQEKIAFQLNIL